MYHPRPVLIWNKDILKVFAYCGQGPSIPNFPWTLAHGPRWFVPKIATGAATSKQKPRPELGCWPRLKYISQSQEEPRSTGVSPCTAIQAESQRE